jgi:hypothetical protein
MAQLVSLMYHGVGAPADPAEGRRYTVQVSEFDEQLALLDECETPVVNPARAPLEPGIALTFDDGEASVAREAGGVVHDHGVDWSKGLPR